MSHIRPLDLNATATASCLKWLTESEHARYRRFATDALRHDYIAARWLCRATLSHYTGVDPAAWVFQTGRHGKPQIAGPAEFVSLRFNLTHTAGLVACAVTRAGEVGVDAEETSRAADVEAIARQFFSPAEQTWIAQVSGAARIDRFFQCWVAKEAWLKGRGEGLLAPPDTMGLEWDETERPRQPNGWQLTLHRPTSGHLAAVAVQHLKGAAPIPVTWRAATELSHA